MNGKPIMILSPALEAKQLLDDAIAVVSAELAAGIAGMPYHVGNGVAPHPIACMAAASKLCQKFAGAVLASVEFERAIADMQQLQNRHELLQTITAEEGAMVTFTGSNPDFNGLPNEAVTVCNAATGWSDHVFRADTIEACLQAAVDFSGKAA